MERYLEESYDLKNTLGFANVEPLSGLVGNRLRFAGNIPFETLLDRLVLHAQMNCMRFEDTPWYIQARLQFPGCAWESVRITTWYISPKAHDFGVFETEWSFIGNSSADSDELGDAPQKEITMDTSVTPVTVETPVAPISIYYECYVQRPSYAHLAKRHVFDLRQDAPRKQSSGRWTAFYNDPNFTGWACEFYHFSADILAFADLCWYTGIRVRLIDRTLNRDQFFSPSEIVLPRQSRQRPNSYGLHTPEVHDAFYWPLVDWRRENNSYSQERDEQHGLYSELGYIRQALADVLAPTQDLLRKLEVYVQQYAQYTDDGYCTTMADQVGLAQTFAQLWELDLPANPTSSELEKIILQGLAYLQYDIKPSRAVEAEWTVNERFHILAPFVPFSA